MEADQRGGFGPVVNHCALAGDREPLGVGGVRLRGEVVTVGVVPPEQAFEPAPFLDALATTGCSVEFGEPGSLEYAEGQELEFEPGLDLKR